MPRSCRGWPRTSCAILTSRPSWLAIWKAASTGTRPTRTTSRRRSSIDQRSSRTRCSWPASTWSTCSAWRAPRGSCQISSSAGPTPRSGSACWMRPEPSRGSPRSWASIRTCSWWPAGGRRRSGLTRRGRPDYRPVTGTGGPRNMSSTYRYQIPVEQTQWKFEGQSETILNWEYEDGRSKLLALYDKGKKQQWDAATRIDWSQDLDPENPMMLDDRAVQIWGSPVWERLTDKERVRVRHHLQAQTLSQFMHGEQGALIATAKIVQTVPG